MSVRTDFICLMKTKKEDSGEMIGQVEFNYYFAPGGEPRPGFLSLCHHPPAVLVIPGPEPPGPGRISQVPALCCQESDDELWM